MRAWANLYPWDVDGDPAAAGRLAGLGLAGVTLAAAYHAVRAVTPFHPGHRIVTRDAAVYYRADPSRWRGTALRPARLRPAMSRPAGSFERAAAALRAHGLAMTAWAVLTHNDRLGAVVPSAAVRNAFGDTYPWALCLAAPAVREYAVTLAGEVAALAEADAVEFEACGWYGVEHLSAHDKTAGATDGAAAQWLLSVCFCAACRREYAAAGADPEWLAAAVRAAVNAPAEGTAPAGAAARAGGITPAGGGVPAGAAALAEGALPGAAADVLLGVRAALATRFQREVIAAARDATPGKPIYLHVHPDPRATGANPGYEPAALAGVTGIVLSCWDPGVAPALVSRAAATAVPSGTVAVARETRTGAAAGSQQDSTIPVAPHARPPGLSRGFRRPYRAG